MNWYKISQISLIFENIHTDSHSGQYNYILLAKDSNSNESLGNIQYSEFDDEIYINMIEVKEEYRRQGIGTQLSKKLKEISGNMKIHWGMMSDKGYFLQQSL